MDPPANPNDLHWFHYFEEQNPPLQWDDQTIELDHYLEMLNHHQNYYINSDELGFQDFDPFDDISLWDNNNWCDDNHDRNDVLTDHVKPIDHDSINVTSDREPNLSSASAADHRGRKRGRWDDDDDGLAPCNDDRSSYVISDVNRVDYHDCQVTSGHEDNNIDHGGGRKLGWWELWDDSFPLLISCIDEDTSGGDLINPIDHHVTISETTNSVTTAVDGGRRRAGRRSMPALELEEIEKLFEMPIVMAAKELNVGLTVLKKRCRELNIKRWPHRKLKSLKSLIQNVKEMGLKEEMEMLEENKRMMKMAPEMELTQRTKKLRQACFKFNYKKRRLLVPNLN